MNQRARAATPTQEDSMKNLAVVVLISLIVVAPHYGYPADLDEKVIALATAGPVDPELLERVRGHAELNLRFPVRVVPGPEKASGDLEKQGEALAALKKSSHVALVGLVAPGAAVAAHSSPNTLATPVMALALTTPRTVSPMNSVDTGMTSAMSLASFVSSALGPNTKPAIDMMARTNGKNENRV